jgi:alpha/beta superfamily hydrolase
MRIPIHVDRQGRTLLGILDVPAARVQGSSIILVNYGLNGDRVDNHRLSVLLAERANAAGITVCRFDYAGCGLSSGEFHDTTLQTKTADTLAVVEFLRGSFFDERFKLILLGYSDGIRIIQNILRAGEDICAICAWNPIIRSMTQTFTAAKRARPAVEPTTRKLVFPVFGIYMGLDYLNEVNQDIPIDDILNSPVPKLFVFGTGDVHTLAFQKELKARRDQRQDFDVCEIDSANHIFSRAAWSDQLIETTVEWVLRVSG